MLHGYMVRVPGIDGAAGPAGADGISGYVSVSELGTQSSDSTQSFFVKCPVGKVVTGGGARIYGTLDGQAITTSGPDFDADGSLDAMNLWFVTAIETTATAVSWGLRAVVFCADLTP